MFTPKQVVMHHNGFRFHTTFIFLAEANSRDCTKPQDILADLEPLKMEAIFNWLWIIQTRHKIVPIPQRLWVQHLALRDQREHA